MSQEIVWPIPTTIIPGVYIVLYTLRSLVVDIKMSMRNMILLYESCSIYL